MQDTQEGYEEENPKSKSNWKQAAVIHVKAGSEPEGRRQNPQKNTPKGHTGGKVQRKHKEATFLYAIHLHLLLIFMDSCFKHAHICC